MLTKERLGRTRTIALTIVAASGLFGMTLQPALATAPDIARPAIAIANMDLSALIDQFRSMILNLEARIDELENLLAEASPPAEEADEDDEDESEVDEVDEPEDNDVDEPEDNDVDEPEDNDVDDEDEVDSDDEDEDDREEVEDDHDDEDEDDDESDEDEDDESDEDDD